MSRRIAIGICCRDDVKTGFAFDLVNAVCAHLITGDVVIPMPSTGTLVHSQRTALVQESIKENATHLLFVDSDMRFPQGTIARLLAHNLPVVGANCAKRRMPTGPTAANYHPVDGKVLVYTEQDSTGLEQVDMLGTGVLLIDMAVFGQLKCPWFASPWVEAQNTFMGEDTYFCMMLKRAGIPVYVDHDLSKEIGHIGEFEFRHAHTWAIREVENLKPIKEKEWHSVPSVN